MLFQQIFESTYGLITQKWNPFHAIHAVMYLHQRELQRSMRRFMLVCYFDFSNFHYLVFSFSTLMWHSALKVMRRLHTLLFYIYMTVRCKVIVFPSGWYWKNSVIKILVCLASLLVGSSYVYNCFCYNFVLDEVLKCGVCAYTCISTASMKSHLRIHTKDKPFSCKHCSYTCRQQGKLCWLQHV